MHALTCVPCPIKIDFAAVQALVVDAEGIEIAADRTLFAKDCLTWHGPAAVTKVMLQFKPDFQLRTGL